MEIPHKIEVKPGVVYYVAFVSKFDDPNQIGNCTSGDDVAANRTILIHKELSAEEQYEIFIHELIHAIEFEYGFSVPHKVIYNLQAPLSYVLKQNPGVIPQASQTAAKRPTAKKKKALSKKRTRAK